MDLDSFLRSKRGRQKYQKGYTTKKFKVCIRRNSSEIMTRYLGIHYKIVRKRWGKGLKQEVHRCGFCSGEAAHAACGTARRLTPHFRTCAAPCGGESAARGALRNTIANIKREKHQGQRHEAPQRMAAHIKKNLTICSETLKKRVKIFQQELTCRAGTSIPYILPQTSEGTFLKAPIYGPWFFFHEWPFDVDV